VFSIKCPQINCKLTYAQSCFFFSFYKLFYFLKIHRMKFIANSQARQKSSKWKSVPHFHNLNHFLSTKLLKLYVHIRIIQKAVHNMSHKLKNIYRDFYMNVYMILWIFIMSYISILSVTAMCTCMVCYYEDKCLVCALYYWKARGLYKH